jgi:hypothetical protein
MVGSMVGLGGADLHCWSCSIVCRKRGITIRPIDTSNNWHDVVDRTCRHVLGQYPTRSSSWRTHQILPRRIIFPCLRASFRWPSNLSTNAQRPNFASRVGFFLCNIVHWNNIDLLSLGGCMVQDMGKTYDNEADAKSLHSHHDLLLTMYARLKMINSLHYRPDRSSFLMLAIWQMLPNSPD